MKRRIQLLNILFLVVASQNIWAFDCLSRISFTFLPQKALWPAHQSDSISGIFLSDSSHQSLSAPINIKYTPKTVRLQVNKIDFLQEQPFDKTLFALQENCFAFHYRTIISIPKKEEPILLRNEHAPGWKKMLWGEMIIGSAEILGMGILILLPREVTKWEDDWLADAGRNLERAFTTPPKMDQDDWGFNYIGHPLAGALYYNSVRSQNATWYQSFLFSTFQSFMWEYVIEGVAEQPSTQDLIITPIVGSLLGEVFHNFTMSMRKNGFSPGEKVLTLIINPMFVINNGFGPKHNPVFVP